MNQTNFRFNLLHASKIDFNFVIKVGLILFIFSSFLRAAITGIVKDVDGTPVDNVLIFWEEREISTYTDKLGRFDIENANTQGIYFFDFRKEGYESKVITIELERENKSINVTLKKTKTLRSVRARSRTVQTQAEKDGLASTKISKDTIRKIKLNSADDLSAISANLYNIGTGSSFTSGYGIRGIGGVNNIDPLVGMYIDDIAQFQSFLFPILLGNVDSIEILKGPQTTLYGRNAMAGIIDIKTKVPPNRFSIATSADFGSANDLGFGRQTYDLYFTAPLLKDKLYLKGGGYYYQFDGHTYNETLSKLVGGAENFSTYLRLDNFNKDFDFYFRIKYERLDESPFAYHTNRQAAKDKPFTVYQDREGFSRKDIVDNVVKFSIPFFGLDLDFDLNYQYLTGFVDVDADFTASNETTYDVDLHHHLLTSESRWSSPYEVNSFSWSAGTYWYYQNRTLDTEMATKVSNETIEIDSSETTLGGALFSSFTFPLVNNLYLVLGARADVENKTSKIQQISNSVNFDAQTNNRNYDKTIFVASPKIGMNYYPVPDILLYLSGSRGFRSGGVNSYNSQLSSVAYNPEYSWNIDYGVKTKFLIDGKQGFVNLTGFWIYWTDQQVNAYIPDQDNVFDYAVVNATASENLGAEVEVNLPLFMGVSIGANYGYVHATYHDLKLKDSNNETVDASGKYQIFVPQHTVSAFFQHEFEFELLSLRDSIINRLDFKYLSKSYFDVQNNFSQDGYYLMDYTFNFNLAGFTWTFWVKNIFDKRYFSYAIPANDDIRVKVGDPVSMGGKFAFYF